MLILIINTDMIALMKLIKDLAHISQGMARSGRGAGARHGDWMLHIVESGNVQDGWLDLADLRKISVAQNARTERHLLRPFDVLVTARAWARQAALVPPTVSRTVAGVTLLVVRPKHPEWGMGHFLWYFLTSAFGRVELAKQITTSTTINSLSARSLGEVNVPVPSEHDLERIVQFVNTSEVAYTAAIAAARLRRETLRDALVQEICNRSKSTF